ncbi:Unknown protein sequence [Pseudomonas syringae pv. maculicola]|nr:Unknown protein sequence [Pseudomonas syringae pv. maculicola]
MKVLHGNQTVHNRHRGAAKRRQPLIALSSTDGISSTARIVENARS